MLFDIVSDLKKNDLDKYCKRPDVRLLGNRDVNLARIPRGNPYDKDVSRFIGMDPLSIVCATEADTLASYAFSQYWGFAY